MKFRVPQIEIRFTTKDRHILEILVFIAVILILHKLEVFNFIFGVADKILDQINGLLGYAYVLIRDEIVGMCLHLH